MTALDVDDVFAAPVIALVRHGETDWNLARRIQGHTEVPLNATGRAQARATAELLARTPGPGWSAARSSPLGRAVETAEIIAAGLGLAAPGVDEGFWERNFGPAEGLLVTEARERWPGFDVPGAESLEALADRSAGAMARVLETAPGTVVVAHGAMLRAGLGELTGTDIPRVLNGEVWLLSLASSGYAAQRLDAAAHAPGDELLQR